MDKLILIGDVCTVQNSCFGFYDDQNIVFRSTSCCRVVDKSKIYLLKYLEQEVRGVRGMEA